MPRIEGSTYTVDMDWDPTGKPVLYVTVQGSITVPKDAMDGISEVIRTIDASTFDHVCPVYNLLGLTHMPFLGRFTRGPRSCP